eukprot:CAMPEP_0170191756 /NCGR_PEP_ID=MMETSP0040_2-20121228/52448_1 /TAXON_ID=641309 /ORGANISM="Lotharella oceanica, Strain CCMP622" /LENGTH=816 /DNA_ID=CAMNT_0010439909 /DNA_START=11 /DNA_END=2461 /DNA_ORIENTATION=-
MAASSSGGMTNDRKKELKRLVLRYFQQLTQGCGKPNCENADCASHPGFQRLNKKEALQRAMVLASKKNKPKFCTICTKPAKVEKSSKENGAGKENGAENGSKREAVVVKEPVIEPLTFATFQKLIDEAEGGTQGGSDKKPDYTKAIRMIGKIFADDTALSCSFPSGKELKATEQDSGIEMKNVTAFFTVVEKVAALQEVLNGAIGRLCQQLLDPMKNKPDAPLYTLRKYLILLENPSFLDPEFHPVFRKLCEIITKLPEAQKDILVNWMSKYTAKRMEELIGRIQQYITVRWYTGRQVDDLQYGTTVLGLLYRANEPWRPHEVHHYGEEKSRGGMLFSLRRMAHRDAKERENKSEGDVKTTTKVIISSKGDRHTPLVDPSMFNNDAVNAELSLKADYKRWYEGSKSSFCFCKNPFILDASSKRDILHIDARHQMSEHFRQAMFQRLTFGPIGSSPYLVLMVRRDNLIRDAIIQLQNAKLENMREDEEEENNMYFKKPLKIKFKGEEGVDEGGVKKEFFQLVVAQLFNPKYGMFTYDKESHICWFNKNSVSSDEEFELIGIVLGLAIYNGVILDLRFPMFVYKKLMGYDATMKDLQEVDPEIAKGFEKLLRFDGDVENTYCRTFSVEEEAFGMTRTVELKKDGSKVPLTIENREEYVDLYSKYLLVDSIKRQFTAFKRGFMKVCGGPALKLFRPEELHRLICGSEDLDFEALEKKTQYDGGYNKDTPVIKNLWKVLGRFSLEQKKKFLMFCTGSDRAPINGLGDLSFTISKNGPDSERLPTSHTCFNHLLLPEYATEEKLERSLIVAVQNCKGFGLL